MAQVIDKAAVVAEIEKRIKKYATIDVGDSRELDALYGAKCKALMEILSFIDTLEVKEVDVNLERYVVEGTIAELGRKRPPVTLHGESKAKFKNEFNTVWQLIHGIHFAHVAKHIIEKVCLHFAAWGAYNLKFIGNVEDKESSKFDIQVKEIDLEKEIDEWQGCKAFPEDTAITPLPKRWKL